MTRKLILLAILFTILCTLSPVYAALTPHGVIYKAPAYQGYKTYKNKELGFSFKYPKDWYLNVIDEGALIGELTSFNPHKGIEGMSKDEIVDIKIAIYDDTYNRSYKLDEWILKEFNDPPRWKLLGIRDVFEIKGGKVFLIDTTSEIYGNIGKKNYFMMAYFYLFPQKHRLGKEYNYIVNFCPFELPQKHVNKYIRILKSIEIAHKNDT